jgi:putative endonuclease
MVSRDSFNRFIAVYMMASRRHGTIYTGVTSKLLARVYQHREGLIGGFTKAYGVKRLVWYEPYESMVAAIRRETTLNHPEEVSSPVEDQLDRTGQSLLGGPLPGPLRRSRCAWVAGTSPAMTRKK